MDDLQRGAIERACERLCLDYAHYADNGMASDFGALFADDAELVLGGSIHRGSDISRDVVKRPGMVLRHVLSNIRIEVTGPDEARGTCYLALFVGNLNPELGVVDRKSVV